MLIVSHGYGFFAPEARADCALGSGFFAGSGNFGCSVIVENVGLCHEGILRFAVVGNGARMRTNALCTRPNVKTITLYRIARVRLIRVDCANIINPS